MLTNISSNYTQNTDHFLKEFELISLTVLFFVTLVAHSLVIFLLLCFKRQQKRENVSRMQFYIINLSIADLMVAFLSILTQIFWRHYIIFPIKSNLICKLTAFVQVFPVYGSTFVLLALAYDRYVCICKPLVSYTWTTKNGLCGIGVAWLLAAIVSTPQLFIYSLHNVPMRNGIIRTCWILWATKTRELLYLILNCFGQFLIPLFVLTFLYVKMCHTVSKNAYLKKLSETYLNSTPRNSSKIEEINDNSSRNNSRSLSIEKDRKNIDIDPISNVLSVPMLKKLSNAPLVVPLRQSQTSNKLSKTKMKTFKLTCIVIIAYILCTAPFYISIICFTFMKSGTKNDNAKHKTYLFMFTHLLFQLNSCVNPFIYMLTNGGFCKIFKSRKRNQKKNLYQLSTK